MSERTFIRSSGTILLTCLLLLSSNTQALALVVPRPVDSLNLPMEGGNYTPRGPFIAKNAYSGLPGSGTSADPYVLEGYMINGTSTKSAMDLQLLDTHLLVRNNLFQNSGTYGIRIWDCSNITFENNIFRNFNRGFSCYRVHDIIIRGNGFENASYIADYEALNLGSGLTSLIEDNRFNDDDEGISISDGSDLVVRNNTINCTGLAIDVSFTDGVVISNNTLGSAVAGDGIRLFYSLNCTLKGNSLSRSRFEVRPKTMEDWPTIKISDDNTIDGKPIVSLDGVRDKKIIGPFTQFFILNSTNISIEGSSGSLGFFGGIAILSDHIRISNGILVGNLTTLLLHGSDIAVTEMDLDGVCLEADGERIGIDNCTLNRTTTATSISGTNCSVKDCRIGPSVREALNVGEGTYFGSRATSNLSIMDNEMTFETFNWNAQHEGIRVNDKASGLNIRNNSFNGFGIHLPTFAEISMGASLTSHTITPDNTINGTPILYYVGKDGLDITGSVGQLLLFNSSNCIIHDIAFDVPVYPIIAAWLDNTTFEHNSFAGTYSYLYLSRTTDIKFKGNSISNRGIFISNANNALIWQNEIEKGVLLLQSATGCIVRNNHIINASNGITVSGKSTVTINHNQIEGCSKEAIRVSGYSSYPLVVSVDHNNFIENNKDPSTGATKSPQCDFVSATVSWDDGTEGNYWSEYTVRYPSAGNDGNVWNTPYSVSGGTADRYPLMEPVDVVAPVAAVDESMHVVDQGTTVTFDASTSTDDVGVTNICWTVEYDGQPQMGSGDIWSFRFDIAGTYNVGLKVYDAEGNWDELEVLVTVRDTESPIAEAGPDIHADQGSNVTMDGSDSSDNVGISDWNWTFIYNGTVVVLHGEKVRWMFDLPGRYTVDLTVTDTSAHTGTDSVNITIHDITPPVAQAGQDQAVPSGTNVTLDGSGSTDNVGIATYQWSFLYNSSTVILHGEIVGFTFDMVGRYEVTLVVTDAEGNEASDVVVINAHDVEPPVIVTELVMETRIGEQTIFDASSSTDNVGITRFVWNLTDGTTVTLEGAIVSHVFLDPGIHEVLLRVTDAAGNVAETTIVVTVRDLTIPVAEAGPDITVNQGTTVTLDATKSTDNVAVTGWWWAFEHGGKAVNLSGATPQFTFTVPGTYVITLQVVDADGNSDTDIVTVTVRDTEPPVAEAGPDQEVGTDEKVAFDGSASTDNVGIVRWEWTVTLGIDTIMGDYDGMQMEIHLASAGTYNVTLKVYDAAGNEGTDQSKVRVLSADTPRANAGPDIASATGEEITLDGTGTTSAKPVKTYAWTFVYKGDMVTRQGASTTFRFDVPGIYMVTLNVTNTLGLWDTDTMTVTVKDTVNPVAIIKALGKIGADRRILLSAEESSDNVGIINWTWTIRKSNTVVTTLYGISMNYLFPSDGHYSINLTVRDAEGNFASDASEVDVGGNGSTSSLLVPTLLLAVGVAVMCAIIFVWRKKHA